VPIDPDALYRRYGPMVLRRCRRMLGDEAQAVDAMQDVFVELCRRRARLDDRAPSALLYRMATHRCLNLIRGRSRRPEVPDGGLIGRIAAAGPDDGTAARSVLAQLFKGAPDSSRTIAMLHLVDGLTLEQTAEAVGMSVSGIRKRLRRLRAELTALEAA
jgi:RNA polymerase sigma factor (sigma-70 family)